MGALANTGGRGEFTHDPAAVFESYDMDGSGTLDFMEFRYAVGDLGIGLLPSECDKLCKAVDTDGNGTIR